MTTEAIDPKDKTTVEENDQMAAYSEAVSSGLYDKQDGTIGKYDNVRRFWEDEITRQQLAGPLTDMLAERRAEGHRLRIMDLGCGSGDGFELLAGIQDHSKPLHDQDGVLLTADNLGTYAGLDLSTALLDQARLYYGDHDTMVFRQADFTHGLPLDGDDPYDVYFASYGTWSHHNDDETAIHLMADIAATADNDALIVCDWLGRYSYEWQELWTDDPAGFRNMDYVVSYIYPEAEREAKRDELEHLTLRLMSRPEAEHIVAEAAKRARRTIRPVKWFDRSVLCGRHMDTREYNAHAQPLRAVLNSLHEQNRRTELAALEFNYHEQDGFGEQNLFFRALQAEWNALVHYTRQLLYNYDDDTGLLSNPAAPAPRCYSEHLRDLMARMRRVVESSSWLENCLPRENVIEPQLGYALRDLVVANQQGMGCAHGLCGVFLVEND